MVRRPTGYKPAAPEPPPPLNRLDRVMLTVVACVIAIAAFRTPWRALTPIERVWAGLALCDAVVTFAIPTVAATSPWRRVEERALWTCAFVCIALIVAGVPLVHARVTARQSVWPLMPPFGVLAVPAFGIVLVSLLWGLAGS
jgi:hypothetical protein